MEKNSKKIYKRVLLKISGEIFSRNRKLEINFKKVKNLVFDIKELLYKDIEIGIVIGGGNIYRGRDNKNRCIDPITGDYVGILSTTINGLLMYDILNEEKIKTKIMSSIPIRGICDGYNFQEARKLMSAGYVLIFSSGIGNPFFTTDSASCIRAIEMKANALLKATKVNGVFSTDPKKNVNSKFYKKISYQKILDKNIQMIDYYAIFLAKKYKIPIHIFNMNKRGALKRIIFGKNEGTLIT